MDRKQLSKEDEEFIKGAELIVTYEDDHRKHWGVILLCGFELHYIETKSDNKIVLDMDMIARANGYKNIGHYLEEKPLMVDALLDGMNKGLLII